MTTTADRVRSILQLHLDAENPPDTAHLFNDLGADSLDTIELVMAIEEEFGIELPEEKVADIATVGDLIALVEQAIPETNNH